MKKKQVLDERGDEYGCKVFTYLFRLRGSGLPEP